MKQKIAFIGGGNMAEGIIRGMLKEASFLPEEIYVYDIISCLLYTSPSPRDKRQYRMPSSA